MPARTATRYPVGPGATARGSVRGGPAPCYAWHASPRVADRKNRLHFGNDRLVRFRQMGPERGGRFQRVGCAGGRGAAGSLAWVPGSAGRRVQEWRMGSRSGRIPWGRQASCREPVLGRVVAVGWRLVERPPRVAVPGVEVVAEPVGRGSEAPRCRRFASPVGDEGRRRMSTTPPAHPAPAPPVESLQPASSQREARATPGRAFRRGGGWR